MLLEPNLIGKPITSVFGSVYFDNQNNIKEEFDGTDIIDFCISFDDINITIKGSSDGESLIISPDSSLINIDMQDQGYIQVMNLSKYLGIEDYFGLNLLTLRFINLEQKSIGVLFTFPNEKEIYIINLGDELHFFKSFPNRLLPDGYKIMEQFYGNSPLSKLT